MADFKKQGGVLTGREERFDGFEGEPRSVGGALGAGGIASEVTGSHHHHGTHSSTTGTSGSTGMMGKAKEAIAEAKYEERRQ